MIHSRQPVALNWARNSFGLVLTVFLRKICILGIAEYFLIVLFQISEIKKDEIRFKKYIFLLDMFLIVGGEGSSNRNASRDESVEAGDKSVEAGDESIEAGEKTPQSCYNWIYWWMMIGGHWSWWLIVKIHCWSRILIMTIMVDDLADYYCKWVFIIMHDDYKWWLVIRIDLWWLLIDYDQDWFWLLIMILEDNDCCMVIMDEDWLMMADWDHDW